jgi:hypothetical protein
VSAIPEQTLIMHPEALWCLADVAVYFRRGETKARQIVSQPGFPKPVRLLGPDSHPLWRAGDVWEWVRQQAA